MQKKAYSTFFILVVFLLLYSGRASYGQQLGPENAENFQVEKEYTYGGKKYHVGRLLLHDFSYGPLTLRVIEKDKTTDIQAPMDDYPDLEMSHTDLIQLQGRPFFLVIDRYRIYLVDLENEKISARIQPGLGVEYGDDSISSTVGGFQFFDQDQYLIGIAVNYGLFCFNISDLAQPKELLRYTGHYGDQGQPYFFLEQNNDGSYNGLVSRSDTLKKSSHISNFYSATEKATYLFRHAQIMPPNETYINPVHDEAPKSTLLLYEKDTNGKKTPWVIDLNKGALIKGESVQKPRYVPFQYQGEIGITDVDRNVHNRPGTFGDYHVVGDFESYILRDQSFTQMDFFFNAISGEGEGQIYGTLDRACGPLTIGSHSYFHFWVDGASVMVSYGNEPIYLQQDYIQIEPNRQAWGNEYLSDKQVVWALKADYTYDVLQPEQRFSPVENLPDFTSYDLVFGTPEAGVMQLKGFVLGSWEAIDRQIGQLYGIPPSDSVVTVYDINFKKIGTSAYREKDISALMDEEVHLRGSMMPPPQTKHQAIYSSGKTHVLNDEFSLVPDTADGNRLVLVHLQKDNEPVLGEGDFDYRYFSTKNNSKALLQVRHGESGTVFFFDFDGTFFPKGIPMIPKDNMEWLIE